LESFKLTTAKAAKPTFWLPAAWTTELAAYRVSEQEQIMFRSIKNFAADESGVTAIEYALIASLIAVFIIVAVQSVGTKVSTVFNEIASTLK
jgi:pilus assembly protein Flp/PilA